MVRNVVGSELPRLKVGLSFPVLSSSLSARLQGCISATPSNGLVAFRHTGMPGLSLPSSIPAAESLAIPAVSFLIFFLAYSSQYLFYYIEPGPLSFKEVVWFNIFVAAIWWCYDRACTVDPGRKGWVDEVIPVREANEADGSVLTFDKGLRWCKKCNAVKPARAHHCRKCGRYVSSVLCGIWFCC